MEAESTGGVGGNIRLTAGNLLLLSRNSLISAISGTPGSDGQDSNIEINARRLVALPGQNSDIVATSFGLNPRSNILINSKVVLGIQFRSQLTPDNDIVATGSTPPPRINFNIDDTLLTNTNLDLDTEKLLANSCLIRRNTPQGTFYIIGNKSLPPRPTDRALSEYPTTPTQSISQFPNRPWQIGDPIIEPQGFYKLADGRLVMSHECPSSQQTPANDSSN